MKLVAILVILYRSAHQNNSNYILLFIAIYLYSVRARVNAIIFFNHLGLLVSYNVFLRKVKSITISSATFIREQAFNNKLVGMWDNFKYRKNVTGKKIRGIVKFRSITKAL